MVLTHTTHVTAVHPDVPNMSHTLGADSVEPSASLGEIPTSSNTPVLRMLATSRLAWIRLYTFPGCMVMCLVMIPGRVLGLA